MLNIDEPLPPLNWLKTFATAAQALNFTTAAKSLNMTQSAVSQQIRLLEDHLQQPLFHREHKKLTLTNTGMAYLPAVQEALELIQRSTHDIFSPVKYGTLTLQVNTAFLLLWLAPRIQEFTQLYPDITLRFMSINWDNDRLGMSTDLIISHGRGAWHNVEMHQLLTPKLRPFCSPDTALQIRNGATLDNFALIDIMGNHQQWNDWLKTADSKMPSKPIKHQVDTAAAAVQLAIQSVGICLAYDELVTKEVSTGSLVAPFEGYVETVDNYYLIHNVDRPLSKTATVFKGWLLAALKID
jgi:LysR family glycine cleavage system transcriptional activator